MTDRERILTNLVVRLAAELQIHQMRLPPPDEETRGIRVTGPDFGTGKISAAPGDIVVGMTAGFRRPDTWSVCRLDHQLGHSDAVVRDLANPELLCRYGNERFLHVRVDMDDPVYLVGAQRKLYVKAEKAFRRADPHKQRFYGVEFDADDPCLARILIGPRYGTSFFRDDRQYMEVVPWEIEVRFNSRTTIKSILEAMEAAGLGTDKEFELIPSLARVRKELSSTIFNLLDRAPGISMLRSVQDVIKAGTGTLITQGIRLQTRDERRDFFASIDDHDALVRTHKALREVETRQWEERQAAGKNPLL
jgi:hypothetical protein